jgi:hypothetical protein
MTTKALCAFGVLALALSTFACGGGSSGGTGGSTGTGGAGTGTGGAGGTSGSDFTKSPCYAYCMARDVKKDCDPTMSVENCVGYTQGCGEDFATLKTACQNAYKAYWTCIAGQADPCDLPGGCATQAEALGNACN